MRRGRKAHLLGGGAGGGGGLPRGALRTLQRLLGRALLLHRLLPERFGLAHLGLGLLQLHNTAARRACEHGGDAAKSKGRARGPRAGRASHGAHRGGALLQLLALLRGGGAAAAAALLRLVLGHAPLQLLLGAAAQLHVLARLRTPRAPTRTRTQESAAPEPL